MRRDMDHKELRERRRYLYEQNKRYLPGVFAEIPKSEWPPMRMPVVPVKAVRSSQFIVQIFEYNDITRLSISRTELDNTGDWKGGITWDELQSIKDACGYSDFDAVEVYPKKQDVVNVANLRHLWIIPPEHTQFIWRQQV